MDDRLKELMKRLGAAINDSLSESESVAEVIGDIRGSGYDVFMVLEATIGFNRREDAVDKDAADNSGAAVETSGSGGDFTDLDHAFLRSLKIKTEE